MAATFRDMETELPILSFRKIVKRRNKVKFVLGGGAIETRDAGKAIRFYEYEGFSLKDKLIGPDDDLDQLACVRPGHP